MTLSIDPVGGNQLQTFFFQLIALLFVPVGFDQCPALIPGIKEERSKYDTEIRNPVICIECTICYGTNIFTQQHGVDQGRLIAQL